MAGYNGYSMSNNAVDAYLGGEKPKSRWTKAAILEAVSEIDESKAERLRKVPLDALRGAVLSYSSWHHTSSHYNRTDFYSVSESKVDALTDEEISKLEKRKKPKPKTERYRGTLEYLEWSGTRNHPKATRRILDDVIIEERGSFYYAYDDDGELIIRKKMFSNGTHASKKKD